ncbi:hypothetical protein FVE85_3156 [Porphyridium purpureum]|uniref:Uncharacterized protein n=1 Tax=Porphyridium purpureum TaxID=35688 RepID=A0A5J4YUJ1_PORPP|nr:hypothetical protein FVE85_3156 [Porphyridium purpureum]|eukprot:POR9017..scf227_4
MAGPAGRVQPTHGHAQTHVRGPYSGTRSSAGSQSESNPSLGSTGSLGSGLGGAPRHVNMPPSAAIRDARGRYVFQSQDASPCTVPPTVPSFRQVQTQRSSPVRISYSSSRSRYSSPPSLPSERVPITLQALLNDTREPVLQSRDYGYEWLWGRDYITLFQNAIRKELQDLYSMILMGMRKAEFDLEQRALDDLGSWWRVLVLFIKLYFDSQRRYLFPRLLACEPDDVEGSMVARELYVLSTEKNDIVNKLQEVAFRLQKMSEVYDLTTVVEFLDAVDESSRMLLLYMNMEFVLLGDLIEMFLCPEDMFEIENCTVHYLFRQPREGQVFLVMLTRWMSLNNQEWMMRDFKERLGISTAQYMQWLETHRKQRRVLVDYFTHLRRAFQVCLELSPKNPIRLPVLCLEDYGYSWSWARDILSVSHNSVRREMLDMYTILISIQSRNFRVTKRETLDAVTWMLTFRKLLQDWRAVERNVVFPFVDGLDPRRSFGKIPYNTAQIFRLRDTMDARLSKVWSAVDQVKWSTNNEALSKQNSSISHTNGSKTKQQAATSGRRRNMYRGLSTNSIIQHRDAGAELNGSLKQRLMAMVACIEAWSQSMVEYMNALEVSAVPMIECSSNPGMCMRIVDKTVEQYIQSSENGAMNAWFLFRWLEDEERQRAWMERHVRPRRAFLFTLGKTRFERSHLQIVQRFLQAKKEHDAFIRSTVAASKKGTSVNDGETSASVPAQNAVRSTAAGLGHTISAGASPGIQTSSAPLPSAVKPATAHVRAASVGNDALDRNFVMSQIELSRGAIRSEPFVASQLSSIIELPEIVPNGQVEPFRVNPSTKRPDACGKSNFESGVGRILVTFNGRALPSNSADSVLVGSDGKVGEILNDFGMEADMNVFEALTLSPSSRVEAMSDSLLGSGTAF